MFSRSRITSLFYLILSLFLTVGPLSAQAKVCDLIFSEVIDVEFENQLQTLAKNPGKFTAQEINQKFGLSKETLEFVNPLPWQRLIIGLQVEELKYHRALSEGVVYITNRSDMRDHIVGLTRIAHTDIWANTKQILRDAFKIIDDPKSTNEQIRKAHFIRRQVGLRIDMYSSEISRLYSTSAVDRAESLIQRLRELINKDLLLRIEELKAEVAKNTEGINPEEVIHERIFKVDVKGDKKLLSLSKINEMYKLSKADLVFKNPFWPLPTYTILRNGNWDVEEDKYHRGLSNGIVYISDKHDVAAHIVGYIRISKTKLWQETKKALKDFFEIIDDSSTALSNRLEARSKIRIIANLIDELTGSLTIVDGSLDRYKFHIDEYSTKLRSVFNQISDLQKEVEASKRSLQLVPVTN